MTVTHQLISRADAAAAGRKTYYDGPAQPCKRGHDSPRYTVNSACIACMQANRPRLNPFTHDKVPFVPVVPFWRTKRHTPETLAELHAYIQTAVDHFEAERFPPLCKTCDGTRYVPVKGEVPPRWEACPTCMMGVPTGTEVAT